MVSVFAPRLAKQLTLLDYVITTALTYKTLVIGLHLDAHVVKSKRGHLKKSTHTIALDTLE